MTEILKQALVGTWRMVSYETKRSDGESSHPFGESPMGLFIFDAAGNYSVQLSRSGEPDSYGASWGVYEADDEAMQFVLSPTAGLQPLTGGTTTVRRVTLNGDGTATFRPPSQVVDGVETQSYITWRKVSGD